MVLRHQRNTVLLCRSNQLGRRHCHLLLVYSMQETPILWFSVKNVRCVHLCTVNIPYSRKFSWANFRENVTRRSRRNFMVFTFAQSSVGKPHLYNAYNIICTQLCRARLLMTSLSRPFKHSRFYFRCSRAICENHESCTMQKFPAIR